MTGHKDLNMSAKPSAIIFDLDGTLVDSAPDLAAALNHVLRQAGRPEIAAAHVGYLIGDGARAMIIKGFSASGTVPDETGTEAILQEFLSYYQQNITRYTTIFPEALNVIKRLVTMGIPLGLCTNKALGFARKLVTEIGLAPYFTVMTGGDSFDYQKPDPRHLIGTLDMMNCPRERAVMIGDTANDIIAAQKAGVAVIGVSFGYSTTPVTAFRPTVVIDHYNSFFDALAKIFQDFPRP